MLRWITTATIFLTLLAGTCAMAPASEWTVIGDGYVPVQTVREAQAPQPATVPHAGTALLVVGDGYVFRHGEPQFAADQSSATAPPCCAEACPGPDCEFMTGGSWAVIGDGYVPGHILRSQAAMSCC